MRLCHSFCNYLSGSQVQVPLYVHCRHSEGSLAPCLSRNIGYGWMVLSPFIVKGLFCLFIGPQIISRWLKLLKVHQPMAKSSHTPTGFRHTGSTGLVVNVIMGCLRGHPKLSSTIRVVRGMALFTSRKLFEKTPEGHAH